MTPTFYRPAWATLILHLREIDPTAHIGGGCLRDTALGRRVKDIDVFADVRKAAPLRKALAEIFPVENEVVPLDHINGEYEVSDRSVRGVMEFDPADGSEPVNLIVRDGDLLIERNLARFDFGLCRLAFDGKNMFVTDAFHADALNHTFTLLKCENVEQYDQSILRYRRLVEKYEGWSLVVGDEFAAIAKESAAASDPWAALAEVA